MEGKEIGDALFCEIDIPPNTPFIAFTNGVFRTIANFADRRKQGKGRYALYATSNRIYDCYEAAMQGKCLASKCNSPLNLVHSITRGVAVAISKYIFDTKQKLVKLKSGNSVIPANTEIMYSYGRTYKTCDYLVFASNDYI